MVVVVSDGDPDPPWGELAHIRDQRLVRFSLARNHGPYFAHQVVLRASASPCFLVQDADDWSVPDRVKKLLHVLEADGSDFVFSAWRQYRAEQDGCLRPYSVRWKRLGPRTSSDHDGGRQPASRGESFCFDTRLTENFINRASHHGLFRRDALERIGGYYAGFRMNYDTLLTNLLIMTGRVSFVDTPLYCYLMRNDSLSHSESTGPRSEVRIRAKMQLSLLYREALRQHRAWVVGELTSVGLVQRIRSLLSGLVRAEDRAELEWEAARLAAVMHSAGHR